MISQFVAEWEAGYKVVVGVKKESREKRSLFFVRGLFYRLIDRLSEVPLVRNFTGFGLYDRVVVDKLREIDDPYPYFRGLICDPGYARAELPYSQPARKRGITKNNFYSLYDLAMLGITNHSKVPLRLAAMAGFALSIVALIVAAVYLVYKLMFWKTFSLGLAPLVIGVYFLGSVQLFFIGILGEYIGSIHTQVYNRPLVIEKERINFE
jgi:glycosyltransferase involved in cell wall biosynthesis